MRFIKPGILEPFSEVTYSVGGGWRKLTLIKDVMGLPAHNDSMGDFSDHT